MSARPALRQGGAATPDWRLDLAVFVSLCVAATALFALTPLDVASARVFYRPGSADPWPLGSGMPWSALYDLVPWLTGALVAAGLAALAAGLVLQRVTLLREAAYVLLCIALGPVLVVNVVLKDHWGRPRPRDVVELGGTQRYVVSPLRGETGDSFPCGHSSVGFLCALGWWLWRRSRPGWALASLVVGLALGAALGASRMAAGGHFLSDVVWSALITLGVAHALYHYVLHIPAGEPAAPARTGRDETPPGL